MYRLRAAQLYVPWQVTGITVGQGSKRPPVRLTCTCQTRFFFKFIWRIWHSEKWHLLVWEEIIFFSRWNWQLSPSSVLKRRWKARNFITDYTVSCPRCGTVRSHGHENLKSKMFVDFFFSFFSSPSSSEVETEWNHTTTPPRCLHGVLFVIYLWDLSFFLPSCVAEVSRVLGCYNVSFSKQLPTFRNKCK